jgi:hypothetical protein
MSALPPERSLRPGSNRFAQRGAKLSVAFNVPFATHGFAARFATFAIEQNPFPTTRRLGAASRVVLLEAALYVSRPTDIGSTIVFASAAQHINETEHLFVGAA